MDPARTGNLDRLPELCKRSLVRMPEVSSRARPLTEQPTASLGAKNGLLVRLGHVQLTRVSRSESALASRRHLACQMLGPDSACVRAGNADNFVFS